MTEEKKTTTALELIKAILFGFGSVLANAIVTFLAMLVPSLIVWLGFLFLQRDYGVEAPGYLLVLLVFASISVTKEALFK